MICIGVLMHSQRIVGAHLRMNESVVDLAYQAQCYNLAVIQFFLFHQKTKKTIKPSQEEIEQFKLLMTKRIYVIHGSYFINIAARKSYGAQKILRNELSLAQDIGCTKYILHPGASTGWDCKADGIKALSDILSECMQQFPDIDIILENTAHGKKNIGSDLYDFVLIKDLLKGQRAIKFCIDTAHAFVYGYSLQKFDHVPYLVNVIEDTIGFDHIAFLHLNDTQEKFASRFDKHDVPGKGNIGKKALKMFSHHQQLKGVPIIFELPEENLVQLPELVLFFS